MRNLKQKRTSAKLIAIIFLCFCGVLLFKFSGEPLAAEDRVSGPFTSYDRNRDGKLSVDEFRDSELFKRVDSNGDGLITLSEAKLAADQGVFKDQELPEPLSEAPVNESEEGKQQQAGGADREDSDPEDSQMTKGDIRQAAKPVHPHSIGIGTQIRLPSISDWSGQLPGANQDELNQSSDTGLTVYALTSTGCPLCLRYAPTLAKLEDAYSKRGVQFIYVNPNESENEERLSAAIEDHGFDGPYLHDEEMVVTQSLRAKTSTEVFVLDRSGTLRYRGAVDDQYGFGYALEEPRNHFLRDALDSLLDHEDPKITATSAPGCEIYLPSDLPALSEGSVTYHRQIARILQTHCVTCHREEGSAPFALQDYQQASDYGKMIASVVNRGIMPPWFAEGPPPTNLVSKGGEVSADSILGHWANDRSVPSRDRRLLNQWVNEGMPEGDPKDTPVPRVFPKEWEIGKPDLVLQIPEAISIKAEGLMPYQYQVVSTTLTEDKWVSAVEVRPTNPSVVHHVLVFARQPGSRGRDLSGAQGFLAAYVPGNTHQVYPEGYAKKLPAGTRLIFQIHYTPNGKQTTDQTRLGFRFAESQPEHAVRNHGIANHRISIPAQADNHLETASLTVPMDIELLAMMPHMHVRGKAFRFELTYPDGTETRLLEVPRYDFNWQLEYRLPEPLKVPAGSRINLSGWYDNSSNNPANPNPNQNVRWGDQTNEEMMLGYIEFIVDDQASNRQAESGETDKASRRSSASRPTTLLNRIFDRMDADGDGQITPKEFPKATWFEQLDRNGDGVITKQEVQDGPRAAEIN